MTSIDGKNSSTSTAATFEGGLSESKGIQHVLVNGTFVVREGKSVAGVYPGRAVLGKYRH